MEVKTQGLTRGGKHAGVTLAPHPLTPPPHSRPSTTLAALHHTRGLARLRRFTGLHVPFSTFSRLVSMTAILALRPYTWYWFSWLNATSCMRSATGRHVSERGSHRIGAPSLIVPLTVKKPAQRLQHGKGRIAVAEPDGVDRIAHELARQIREAEHVVLIRRREHLRAHPAAPSMK